MRLPVSSTYVVRKRTSSQDASDRGSTPEADVPPGPLHTKKGGKDDEKHEEARAARPPPSEKQRAPPAAW
jgi:hypothetical protein